MLYKEINQKYTGKVNEYLAKGLTINTATMSGSQGEISKIDLTDGKDIYRILIEDFREYGNEEDHRDYEGIQIVVGHSTDQDVKPNQQGNFLTIWNGKIEVIESEKFYQVGFRSGYYGSREEAQVAYDKRMERLDNSGLHDWGTKEEDITSDKTVAIVEPYVREHRGSRVNRKAIRVKKSTNGRTGRKHYKVFYYSHEYVLC